MGQTKDYIVLKPISERFNEAAKEFSDDDIKAIIKIAMEENIKAAIDFRRVGEFIDDFIDDNEDQIKQMISKSLKDRL